MSADLTLRENLEYELKALEVFLTWLRNMNEDQPTLAIRKIENTVAWSWDSIGNSVTRHDPNHPELKERLTEIHTIRNKIACGISEIL